MVYSTLCRQNRLLLTQGIDCVTSRAEKAKSAMRSVKQAKARQPIISFSLLHRLSKPKRTIPQSKINPALILNNPFPVLMCSVPRSCILRQHHPKRARQLRGGNQIAPTSMVDPNQPKPIIPVPCAHPCLQYALAQNRSQPFSNIFSSSVSKRKFPNMSSGDEHACSSTRRTKFR